MLTHLQLRDLVIVDHAELELAQGLTALTGETGAGKSIVVDALLLIAGDRAAGDIVRHGAERAEVAASFAALPGPALAWLEAQAIEHDGEIVVRRVVGADGRSRAYVNGRLLPIQALRELGELLIEIHGQQEFQRLIKRSAQRDLLDEHLSVPGLGAAVSEIYGRYRACRRDFETLQSAAADREARLDLLRYQLQELRTEVPGVAAIEELFVERKRIADRGRLALATQTALSAAYESDGASARDLLAKAHSALRNVADADPGLAGAAALLEEAMIITREAGEALRRYLEALDIDPSRQEQIERQAAALEALARKHRLSVAELPAELARVEQELRTLENAQHTLADYESQLADLSRDYRTAARRLSEARHAAAQGLAKKITHLMQSLGMAGGRFEVAIAPTGEEFGPHGDDDIEFLVSANPGQAPKSIAKVASGGELSRISLAIQVAGAGKTSALCMVFDEVDAGIGGAVAEIVGRQLRDLGARTQVLCVTHLAQVAAQAHNQFRVTKTSEDGMSRTTVDSLDPQERVEEIGRMLGGIDITEQARAHAREMLTRAAPAETNKKKRSRSGAA
jgi:DNA repair protein RecN (Recombination protein N)